jgi:choline dehydrogenase-like flavoprotein
MTTTQLSPSEANAFDYLIIGGGTAGCVIASRLVEYLPHKNILLIEAGPSDFMNDKVLNLKDWLNLLGGELDYDYGTTDQPNGNSHIRHSRAKVLGGCSSHNTLISFRPFKYDCKVWESKGCQGWSFETFMRVLDNLRNTVQPVHSRHRNQLCKDWIESCSTALDIPVIHDFNQEIKAKGNLEEGVGFFSVAYNPDDGRRSSASVAYIHPILRGEEKRPNLTILTNAWVSRVNVEDSVVTGVNVSLQNGSDLTLHARKETILCAGAVDTPRLLLLSGIGPSSQLSSLSIPLVKDIPGIGHNLIDHPESIIMWELNKPVPANQTTMDSDAGIFLRSSRIQNLPDEPVDMMMHCYQIPFCLNTARLGYDTPIDAFCMTPNIPRPRSKGQLYLTSKDPNVKPALDFKYFTDPEGYDAATIVAGFKAAREVAKQEPFKSWLKREVAPGPSITSNEDLSAYGRKAAHTVYHPAGTTKMGDLDKDDMAVVDSKLRLRGLKGLRIADAGVFPEMTTANPMLTVLAIGERCAEMVAEEAGWRRVEKARL